MPTALAAGSLSEERVQAALVAWSRSHQDARLHSLFHVPNGGQRSGREGGRMVALGAQAGVPDLFLPVPIGRCGGCWIEMKKPGGVASPAQTRWLALLASRGYHTAICTSVADAQRVLLAYLAPHDRAQNHTKLVRIHSDPHAPCPRW